MKKSSNNANSEDYISVSIYKDFYFNKSLGLSTILKEYPKLEKVFAENQYLACITVPVSHLQKIEYRYGSDLYNKMLSRITELLKTLRDEGFRTEDIFVNTLTMTIHDPELRDKVNDFQIPS